MSVRNVILLCAALLIAGGTAFFARSWVLSQRAQIATAAPAPAPKAKHSILVAKADLPAGLFLREEHLRWQAWPDDTLDPNYILEDQHDMTSLLGAVVRRGIVAGEPITESRIARPGDRGFLAAVLKPGMRAVAISVNDTTGIAGLVFPGDRVDIILTHTVSAEGGEDDRQARASETVLENVRILAIDQTLNDQSGEPNLAKTATIELTPKQVEMIAVVVELGRLSLSLRSLGKPELIEEGAVLAASTEATLPEEGVTEGGAADAKPAQDPIAAIGEIAEPQRGKSFTRDSEVSRLIATRDVRRVLVVNGSAISEAQVDPN